MITKAELLKNAITQFTQLGSKHVTLDELAKMQGISKKTIYNYFENKEDLVAASVETLLDDYTEEINHIVTTNNNDPILCVVLIYKRGFEYLKYFKPSFIFGLKKYYPKAHTLFETFRSNLANNITFNLLKEAKKKGFIRQDVDLKLIVLLYFLRIDNVAFKTNNLFELFSEEAMLKHLVVYNLRGITTNNYSNSYFK